MKVTDKNKLPSKIKRRKWGDDHIKYGFFIPQVKNRAMSCLLSVGFSILKLTSFFHSKLRSPFQNKHGTRQNKSSQFF